MSVARSCPRPADAVPTPSPRADARRLRVCIACGEFLGPFRNGGVGTAYTRLAELLNAAGHDVTLLYTNGRYTLTQSVEYWTEHYRERGMRFIPLPDSPVPLRTVSYFLEVAYRVYLWLKSHDEFDLVHFPECNGLGYYALTARRQGLILRDATTIVGLHSSAEWIRVASEELARSESDLEDDFLDRRSAELADIVWSPSRYMLDWVRGRGWNLPEAAEVRPYLVRQPCQSSDPAGDVHPIKELVFFGRQETRKGLFLFLDAVEQLTRSLKDDERRDLAVTVLGKPTAILGEDSRQIIAERTRGWPLEVRIVPDRDERQALEYLRGKGRLAVIPSLVENYPNTVLECLAQRVPFLASRVGGIPEQVAAEDLERVCVEPEPGALAGRLREALRRGQAPARLAFDAQANSRDWVRWHEQIHEQFRSRRAPGDSFSLSAAAGGPTVSVCLAYLGCPDLLRETLVSLLDQDRPPLEVLIIDLGGRDELVDRELSAIERAFDFVGRGWRLAGRGDRDLGSLRNRAAVEARGDYLLVMDEGTIACPCAISTFSAAARRTGADSLTCLIDVGRDGVRSGVPGHVDYRGLFSGANFPLALLRNSFGSSGAVFRREAFLAVGGFRNELRPGQEDWELFVRLMVRGYRLEVIPEPLLWDRPAPRRVSWSTPAHGSHLATLRSYAGSLPIPYRTLLELTVGQALALRTAATPAVTDGAPQQGSLLPLRYRLVNALNLRLKRARLIHRAAKVSVQGLLRARRRVVSRIHAIRATGEIRDESTCHDGPGPLRRHRSRANDRALAGEGSRKASGGAARA